MFGSLLGGGSSGGGGGDSSGGVGGFLNAPLSLASHFMRAKAQKKALAAQEKAIQNLKGIDIAEYKQAAKTGDVEFYVNRLENLRQADPELASVRSAGVSALNNAIAGEGASKGRELTNLIASEAGMQPKYQALEDQLIQRAQENLTLRGKFSPDYQAELIRTGLESAGTTGVGPNRTGALAQMLGKTIGKEQVALENMRTQQAQSLINQAQNVQQQRINTLAGLLPYAQGLPQAQLGMTGIQLANQLGPGGGLSGTDVVNMMEQNRALENAKISALGGLNAQGALLQGEKIAGALDIANRASSGLVNTAANMAGNYFTGGMSGNMFGSSNPNVGSSLSPTLSGWGAGGTNLADLSTLSSLGQPSALRSSYAMGNYY